MTKAIQKYLEYLRYEKNYSSHTEISYSVDLGQFESFLNEENLSLEQADSDIVRRWMVSLVDKGMTARTVNRKLSAVKSFYEYLQRRGGARATKILSVVGPKVSKPIPNFVSDGDLSEILSEDNYDDSFTSRRTHTVLELFYMTGIRRAELIGLKNVDVDLAEATIKVTGKRNKQRIIPISQRMVSVLQDYSELRDKEVGQTECFFVRENGEPLYPMLVHRMVSERLEQISTLSKTSPHVLRHSFATAMLNNGADINAIKELLEACEPFSNGDIHAYIIRRIKKST